jgi:hypothetical protein
MKRLLLPLALAAATFFVPSAQALQYAQAQSTRLQGNPAVKVWVNTASAVYHCPGTRWYGSTKHGGVHEPEGCDCKR